MIRIISLILGFLLLVEVSYAASVIGVPIGLEEQPDHSFFSGQRGWTFLDLLSAVEQFLLRVVLPLVIIGSAIYIAYGLFLAEGNEEKNKKAWKSLTYSAIGVLSVALAYAFVAIISRLSI